MNMFQKIFIFLLVIIAFRFFDAQFLNKSVVNYSCYLFLILTIALSLPYVLLKPIGFVLPVQLILVSMFISVFMANMSWGQSFYDTAIETIPCMIWIFFFYLLNKKVQIETIERIILFYGVVYVLLYLYQFINTPTVLFGVGGDEYNEFALTRGITRIIFPGAGIFILSVFISINKLTTESKGKWFWLVFAIIGIIIPVLQVTRQFIAGVVLIYIYHFLKGQNIIRKFLVFAGFFLFFLYITTVDNEILKGINEATVEDLKQGENYIRVQAGRYFLLDFSPNNINRVLGNGAPYWEFSSYGAFIENLAETQGFYLSDVGIIGMYAMFGILPVIAFILIWVKSYRYSVPKNFVYLKYYLFYLLFTSLTWFTVYHYHYVISTVFVLYIYQIIYQKKFEVEELSKKVI